MLMQVDNDEHRAEVACAVGIVRKGEGYSTTGEKPRISTMIIIEGYRVCSVVGHRVGSVMDTV